MDKQVEVESESSEDEVLLKAPISADFIEAKSTPELLLQAQVLTCFLQAAGQGNLETALICAREVHRSEDDWTSPDAMKTVVCGNTRSSGRYFKSSNVEERRCLEDGVPYTFSEFVEYFGQEKGKNKWESAQSLPRAKAEAPRMQAERRMSRNEVPAMPPPDSIEQSRMEVARLFKLAAAQGVLGDALDLRPKICETRPPTDDHLLHSVSVSKDQLPATPACGFSREPIPSWWDRYFSVYYRNVDTLVGLKLKGLGLGDADIGSICLALDSFFTRKVDPKLLLELELDISDNDLSDRGGVHLIGWLGRLLAARIGGLRLRVLKMFKNRVSDETCEALAALLMTMPLPIEEIHLSHNEIEQRGFVSLLAALALHPERIYPRQTRGDPCPCWLRIEHNQVADTQGLLEALASEPVDLRICLATRNSGGPSCSSFQCFADILTDDSVAHVHVYCAHAQSSPSTAVREKPQMLVRQVAAAILKGELRPAIDKFSVDDCAQFDSSFQDTVSVRAVLLRVAEHGAGIDLVHCEYGFVVQCIDQDPGQELDIGNVITQIADVPLWGLDEDSASVAFGSRFGDRAPLHVVASERDLKGRSLWQPLAILGGDLDKRCGSLLVALSEDLMEFGKRHGVKSELLSEHSAVAIRGAPQAQRWAVAEIQELVQFYFPECCSNATLPLARWCCQGPDHIDVGYPEKLSQGKQLAPIVHLEARNGAEEAVEVAEMCESMELESMKLSQLQRRAEDLGALAEEMEAAIDDPHPKDAMIKLILLRQSRQTVESEAAEVADITTWASALHRQWTEDSNYFDEDLPCDPLEAPDDGPDMFDGDAFGPEVDMILPLRILILVGLPGSGKSTLSRELWDMGWYIVNQDTLGDRKKCVVAARDYLKAERRIVIDRCNVSHIQRRVWLDLADEFKVCAGCLWLDVGAEECGRRVLQRFGHQTLPADRSSLQVIQSFAGSFEAPVVAEGFLLWAARNRDGIDNALAEILDVAEYSEVEYKENASVGVHQNFERPDDYEHSRKNAREKKVDGPGFKYADLRNRGARSKFLRAVRRQIEYYFSDSSLKQDWFFQEKIAEEPQAGWLELRWILSCPRIQNHLKANDSDVLEALGPSNLMVRSVNGVFWVRRGRPLPALVEPRPSKGCEPDWYREFHENTAKDSNRAEMLVAIDDESDADHPRCIACGKARPKADFSKAQLQKHRKAPCCKDCTNPPQG